MAKLRGQNSRTQIKDELKKEVNEYNELNFKKKNVKDFINKADLEKNIQLTPKQNELFKAIKNNTLTIVQGPSGTAKTFTACYTALSLYLTGKISKIIITKPLQTGGLEEIGILPGTLSEKVSPFMNSYIANFEKIIGKQKTNFLIENGVISIETLAFMRGATFSDSIILLDEAQNCSLSQLMLWITRLGGGIDGTISKAVLMGDISQYDIKKKDSKMLEFIDMVNGIENICEFKFTKEDIVRHKIIIEIVERYEKYKSNHSEL